MIVSNMIMGLQEEQVKSTVEEVRDSKDSDHATEWGEAHMEEEEAPVEMEIVWGNVLKFIILHTQALWGFTLLPSLSLASWTFLFITYEMSGLGITAGVHRLWAHKSYKAKFPLRVFLIIANSMGGQDSVYTWCRDHRLHHKGTETHADPYNSNRGFFFAHMGWLCVRKHPAVKRVGKTIIMPDLEADPVVMFQHQHYLPCFFLASFVLPTLLPHLLWGESLSTAYLMAVVRYIATCHFTWLVNSAAHLFGTKPYDKTIGPTENRLVSVLTMGEGFHNYHHTFPYDYSTSEMGFRLSGTTWFIDAMAWLGQAYDLKSASPATVEARARRTGDWSLTRAGGGEIKNE